MLNEPRHAVLCACQPVRRRPQFADILNKSGYGHRVLRYELYDDDGSLTFTSGPAGLQLDDELATVLASADDERPRSRSIKRSGTCRLANFAVAHPSARPERRADAEPCVVYLDQSDQATVLSSYFGLIAGITLLLLGAGIAAPAAFAWMRSGERRHAEAQVSLSRGARRAHRASPTARRSTRASTDALDAHAARPDAHRRALPRHRQVQGDQRRRRSLAAAMRCCARSATASSRRCARATSSPGWAATSSPSPWSTSPISATSWPS